MVTQRLLAALAGLTLASAQGIGSTPEVHPQLTTQKCTTKGGCETHLTNIVLDAGSHPLVDVNTGSSCFNSTGGLDPALCSTPESCAKNCVYEAADYAANGVYADGDSLTMRMYLGSGANITDVSPRIYLLEKDGKNYRNLQLLNKELAFTVNMTNLPCGMNAALYFSEMASNGGRGKNNPAGATYGTGYCDAQCYVDDFFDGVANTQGVGSCCQEMDIWEANARATGLTPHPCNTTGPFGCTGTECGQQGVCDHNGCGFNPYALGAHGFYGYGSNYTVDTSQPFTVVTQFLTDDNTETGTLVEIRRLYVQNGVTIQNAVITAGSYTGDSITSEFCPNVDGYFNDVGGLERMGEALGRGMTLIFSIWNDKGGFMDWLDSGNAGPCNATEGNPALIEVEDPGTDVTWSNIKWGEIGSTY